MNYAMFQDAADTIGSDLVQSRIKGGISLSPEDQYIYYLYPASFGELSEGVSTSGGNVFVPLSPVIIQFENEFGGTTNYYLYVTPNKYNNNLSVYFK